MAGVKVDGYDLQNIGFYLQRAPGWRNAVQQNQPTQAIPDALGVRRTSSRVTAGERSVELRGYQKASDVSTLIQRRDELLFRVWGKDLEVVIPDDTDRIFFARVTDRPRFEDVRPAFVQPRHNVIIPTVLEDPRLYSSTEESLTIASDDASATDVPLGSAPTEAVFDVDQTAFTLTYRDSAGNVVATLKVSGASATPVTVDMGAQTITTSNGGEIETLASGDFFRFDPRDGDFPSSSWPTIEVASGTANVATATITYRKAWL